LEERESDICPKCLQHKQHIQDLQEFKRVLEQEGRIYYYCGICDESWFITPTSEKRAEILEQVSERIPKY
jgi:hypothetical protein